MKKSAVLAAVLLLCTSSAFAYENSYAGYKVNEGSPFFKMESQRTFSFTSLSSKNVVNQKYYDKHPASTTNIIKFYTAEEMEKVTGEKFSTSYFDAEYEKLALLKRSELNLQTVPTPLLEAERYAAVDAATASDINLKSTVLKNAMEKVKPTYSVEKVAGHKAITTSYLFKQLNQLVSVKESLLSVNDRLYAVTTIYVNPSVYKSKEDSADKQEKSPKITKSEDISATIELVAESSLDAAVIADINNQQAALLKNFKPVQPVAQQTAITYTDSVAEKSLTLPQDWFYSQFNMNFSKKSALSITTAASLPEMLKVFEQMNYDKLMQAGAEDAQANHKATVGADAFMLGTVNTPFGGSQVLGTSHTKFRNATVEQMKNAMPYWNSALMTISYKDSGEEIFKELFENPTKTQLGVDSLVSDTLKRAKDFSVKSEKLTLTDYKYTSDYSKEKAALKFDLQLNLFKDYAMNSKIYVGAAKNIATMTFFLKKADFSAENALEKQLDNWQF